MGIYDLIKKTVHRQDSFLIMIEKMKSKPNPLIVETGCARTPNNFGGDGMSTLIWDNYIEEYNGTCYSIDLSEQSIEFARNNTKHVNLICSDSVAYLFNLNKEFRQTNRYIDLLYLDSFDFQPHNPHPSSFHHILELLCIWPSCSKGTIISVDDNFPNGIGKGKYVRQFLDNIGIKPIYNGYQIVWEL